MKSWGGRKLRQKKEKINKKGGENLDVVKNMCVTEEKNPSREKKVQK